MQPCKPRSQMRIICSNFTTQPIQHADFVPYTEAIKQSCVEIKSLLEEITSLLTKRLDLELRSPKTAKIVPCIIIQPY